jgi:hypothetical protein
LRHGISIRCIAVIRVTKRRGFLTHPIQLGVADSKAVSCFTQHRAVCKEGFQFHKECERIHRAAAFFSASQSVKYLIFDMNLMK